MSNVISIVGRIGDRQRPCNHPSFEVDPADGTVMCAQCGKLLNPIWVIERFAEAESQMVKRYEELQALADQAEKRNRCRCEVCGNQTRVIK